MTCEPENLVSTYETWMTARRAASGQTSEWFSGFTDGEVRLPKPGFCGVEELHMWPVDKLVRL